MRPFVQRRRLKWNVNRTSEPGLGANECVPSGKWCESTAFRQFAGCGSVTRRGSTLMSSTVAGAFDRFCRALGSLIHNSLLENIASMTDKHSWAKTQHYVPQFLLKNFAVAEREQIHVFDKREERAFRAHVRRVAAENGLYD